MVWVLKADVVSDLPSAEAAIRALASHSQSSGKGQDLTPDEDISMAFDKTLRATDIAKSHKVHTKTVTTAVKTVSWMVWNNALEELDIFA